METPPRTWGRRPYARTQRRPARNTPTHVGKTTGRSCSRTARKKHPHARGEDGVAERDGRAEVETPPRTWGRPGEKEKSLWTKRNTPTHVGKTEEIWQDARLRGKHPHARGEDTAPRAFTCQAQSAVRNTPTHVGKTQHDALSRRLLLKHPHARGEDNVILVNNTPLQETPPRTWGRLMCLVGDDEVQRNTPTHVGKTG